MPERTILHFGQFRLDLTEKSLATKDGQTIALTPKAFEALSILAVNKGRLIEKDELSRLLWPDTFVVGNSLAQIIYLLRKVLSTYEPGQQFIETVPRRGYRFIARVEHVPEKEVALRRAARGRPAVLMLVSFAVLVALSVAMLILTNAQRSPRRSVTTPEVYEDYMRGMFFWSKRTEDGMTRSIASFRRALEKDPNYAPAWAGLADAYAVSAYLGYALLPEKEAYRQAESAAKRALEIDQNLANAYSALSVVKAYRDYDLAGAEAEARTATRLEPENATAHQRYSIYLRDQGRVGEALKAIRRARDLDPLSLTVNSNLAYLLYLNSEYEDALAECRKIVETEPEYFQALIVMGMAFGELGRWDESIVVLSRVREQRRGNNGVYLNTLETLGYALASKGLRKRSEEIIREIRGIDAPGGDAEYYSALIHAGLGNIDQVFDLLKVSSRTWYTPPVALMLDPRFRTIRGDARYESLVAGFR